VTHLIQRWRIPIAVAVAAHGVGHVLFLVPLLGVADWGQSTHSWLMGEGIAAHMAGTVLWALAMVGFLTLAGSLIGREWCWRWAAVAAPVISLAGLVLFWGNPVTSSAIYATLFDIAVLAIVWMTRSQPALFARS
jgi:hypothetical protein